MDRRSLLQFVPLSALFPSTAAAQHCAAAMPESPYKLRFFTPEEHAKLGALMELIIPADAHSPGARDARTADFADWMVSHSSAAIQKDWRAGLAQLDAAGLVEAAAHELNPRSDRDRFFVRLKNMTIDGYYTSKIGIDRDLGYKGNQYLTRYDGCNHPEHGERQR
jgi:hypothetical protein